MSDHIFTFYMTAFIDYYLQREFTFIYPVMLLFNILFIGYAQ